MLSSIVKIALAASCLLRAVSADPSPDTDPDLIPTPTVTPMMNALTYVGCFSTAAPMVNHGPWRFQSSGNCQPICYELQQPVMGLVNGTDCYCGPLIPPASTQVDNSSCSTPCIGYPKESCGGDDFWTVYLTGITGNKIQNLNPASLSQTSSTATGPATIYVTHAAAAASHKSNTLGVAVGVVVGLIAVAGILVGVLLLLRRQKRKQAENEYKQQLAVSSFVSGGKSHHQSSSSTGDSRLDPEAFAKRVSIGSIADNADYSRKILQIRNPDGF